MIDAVQILFQTRNQNTHLKGLPCWEILINEKTCQKVNDIKTANLRGLDLKLKPSLAGGYNLLINGSLHKYHNCGEHNADQFSFDRLCQSVDSLSDILGIDDDNCKIQGLEIGVNLHIPYSPLRVLKNLVCFQSRPFTTINKRNARKGLQCSLNQYSLKVYDKALISDVDCGNVIRFETHIDKMQVLEDYKIESLSDLRNRGKIYSLINVLKQALGKIVWTDTRVNLNRLSPKEQKQWLFFSNPRTWQSFGKSQRAKNKIKWKALLNKYGNPPDLLPVLINTWELLFNQKVEAEKRLPFYQHYCNNEAEKKATFLPLECTVKRSPSTKQKKEVINAGFPINKKSNIKATEERFCKCCGRKITNQKTGSIYCSEKLYGKSGKKCRNSESNKRRDIKKYIRKAKIKDQYLVISYHSDNVSFSEILHPSELNLNNYLIDQIQKITVLESYDKDIN